LLGKTVQCASGKRAVLVGAVGTAARFAARVSRVVCTALGVMSTDGLLGSLGSRFHATILAVITMARIAHSLVVDDTKFRVALSDIDETSGKSACRVRAVGAAARFAARISSVSCATRGGGMALGQPVLSRQLGRRN